MNKKIFSQVSKEDAGNYTCQVKIPKVFPSEELTYIFIFSTLTQFQAFNVEGQMTSLPQTLDILCKIFLDDHLHRHHHHDHHFQIDQSA